MVSIEQLRDLLERLTCLPAIPHQRLLAFGVVNPRSLLHLQHPPAYAGFSVLRSPVESTADSRPRDLPGQLLLPLPSLFALPNAAR